MLLKTNTERLLLKEMSRYFILFSHAFISTDSLCYCFMSLFSLKKGRKITKTHKSGTDSPGPCHCLCVICSDCVLKLNTSETVA